MQIVFFDGESKSARLHARQLGVYEDPVQWTGEAGSAGFACLLGPVSGEYLVWHRSLDQSVKGVLRVMEDSGYEVGYPDVEDGLVVG